MTDYQRLKKIYQEIASLSLKEDIFSSDEELTIWKTKTKLFLQKKYEEKSDINIYFQEILNNLDWFRSIYFTEACSNALPIFKAYLEEMEEEMEQTQKDILPNSIKQDMDYSKVFIVHGHDGEMRESVARLIEKQEIHPIILSDEVNAGTTIIEKIEKYGNVGAAICIFTPDDIGKGKKEGIEQNRARQNVVLETGYFMGKLGRNRVIILSHGNLEFPSDLQGIVYTGNEWKFKTLKELREMGYSIDLNKI